MNHLFPAKISFAAVLSLVPLGLSAQMDSPTPRPRPRLPQEAPPAEAAPISETPPPIFVPGFAALLNPHPSGAADSNVIIMAPFLVKDHNAAPVVTSPSPAGAPVQNFIQTGVLEQTVGKKTTGQFILLPFFGYRLLW